MKRRATVELVKPNTHIGMLFNVLLDDTVMPYEADKKIEEGITSVYTMLNNLTPEDFAVKVDQVAAEQSAKFETFESFNNEMLEQWTDTQRRNFMYTRDVIKRLGTIGQQDVKDFYEKYLFKTDHADVECRKLSVYVFATDDTPPGNFLARADTAC